MRTRQGKNYTYEELLSKAQAYCAYQERCTSEVNEKLKKLGANSAQIINIIDKLIADDFIDDCRFAETYAHGKFSSRSWGRLKIKTALIQKQVPDNLILKALNKIDEDTYRKRLQLLLEKKNKELKLNQPYIKRQKLYRYAMGKGFESSLIENVLSNITHT